MGISRSSVSTPTTLYPIKGGGSTGSGSTTGSLSIMGSGVLGWLCEDYNSQYYRCESENSGDYGEVCFS